MSFINKYLSSEEDTEYNKKIKTECQLAWEDGDDTHRHGIMKRSSIIKFRQRHQSNGGILKLSTQL